MPCAMDEMRAIAKKHNLIVIEDAAIPIGAIHRGRRIGSLGNLTNFSFYANKNPSTAEGGMVMTDDPELEHRLRVYRLNGLSRDAWKRFHTREFSMSEVVVPGYKYNLTDLQASLGIHPLYRQEAFIARREGLAAYYDESLSEFVHLVRPFARPSCLERGTPRDGQSRHVLHLYAVRLTCRA